MNNALWDLEYRLDDAVKAQVRDLHYNSCNLYSNCIIVHMLTKWTDDSTGICEWGIRMMLKGLGIRKCVSSGLASCIVAIRCIFIILCCSLLMCYHGISSGIYLCISAWVWWVASQLNSDMYVRLWVSGLGHSFWISQLQSTQPHILALPKLRAPARFDNSLSDGTLYLSHAF